METFEHLLQHSLHRLEVSPAGYPLWGLIGDSWCGKAYRKKAESRNKKGQPIEGERCAWRKREPSQRKREDEALAQLREDAFYDNRQVYGSPRLHAELKYQGVHCGRKRVARLMHERGISGDWWKMRKRKVKTTDSQHSNPVAPNLLKHDFTATAANTKWVADITGIATTEGWLYLAALVDIYSRLVVGWAMSKERD